MDTHVHVWDPRLMRYPWLDRVPTLDRTVLPGSIDRDAAATAMIFVQAGCRPEQAVTEVRWVAGLDWPELSGIVADVRLDAADLHERVDELVPEPLVVGVRHTFQELPPNAFTTTAHSAGLNVVAAHGLVFDATVRADQLAELATLHASAPSAVLVVDHLGNPPVHAGWQSADADAWRSGMRAVAHEPNAYVKVSGVSYSEKARPFIHEALDAFGFSRAMLGSDFPVTVTGERRWEQVADTFSPTAECVEALRWRTANTVYGVQPRPGRNPE
ncbi:hypothetical protein ASE16_02130 [Leifsonia sp. Root227]|uniref:amidohydrolase family protein n=1 Tax=Leifsonia sp. Root227 TaxID=1736496 RepID=UPI0006FBAFF5|nr:amidohydrolase family protein [Leifsonia sp. Root227]KRC51891.1 hypothetical protein ASE16_02130 [Leifsonia sp. Root227]